MPDDLSSIEGLADKHRRVLARHHVTDLRGLVQADRRVIHRAMANLRPRPTLELISHWQDEARSMLDEAVTDTSDWHTAASFVVVFSQRQRNGAWERRVEVERTEVEPERNPQVWPGWDCAPVCTWMTGQLGQPANQPLATGRSRRARDPRRPPAAETEPPPSGGARGQRPRSYARSPPASSRAPPAAAHRQRRPHRRGREHRRGEGRRAQPPDPRTELAAPVRVVLTVSGARPGTRLQAVARIQRPDGPGWNPRDPVVPSDPPARPSSTCPRSPRATTSCP